MDEQKKTYLFDIDEEEVSFETEQKEQQDNYVEAEAIEAPVKQDKKSGVLYEIYDWTKSIAIAMVVALILNQFVFAMVQVEGGSMLPTLESKERLVVTKLFYEPKAGDIVVVKSHTLGKFIIKRVIAVSGDTVELRAEGGDVLVNGEILAEPYIKEKMLNIGSVFDYPTTVPEGYVFVLGDNRNNSLDSRELGMVAKEDVVGRAAIRITPFSKFGSIYDNN